MIYTLNEQRMQTLSMGYSALLHGDNVVSDVELCISLLLDLVDGNARGQFSQSQLALDAVDLEDTEISNDGADAASAGQRQSAVLHDLAHAVLVGVVGGDDNLGLVRVGHEVHGAAHTLEDLRGILVSVTLNGKYCSAYLSGNHVVGKVTVGANLEGTKD